VTVVPLPAHGRWARDVRGEGRAVRVSAHAEAGLVTVSLWRDDACVGSVRLAPGKAAELVAGVTEALAHLAAPQHRAADGS
jgi:hypothetical protein